ncbi:MAG: DUF4270 family protein [Flavobacteriales bacterium]
MHSQNNLPNSLKQLGLFAFFLVLFLAQGCKRPDTGIGSEILPASDFLGAFQTDTVTIVPIVEVEDSIRTNNLSSSMLGRFTDPRIGHTVQASIYSQLRLSTTAPTFPANAVIDSVVMALVYTGEYYGTLGEQKFHVYELAEDLYIDSAYYGNQRKHVLFQDLVKPGFETFKPNPEDIVVVGTDTVIPQLRIHLNDDFGYHLLQASETDLASNENFLQYLKGIYITPYQTNSTGIFNFDMVDSDSKLNVYYHYEDENGEEVSTRYDFSINSETSYFTEMYQFYNNSLLSPLATGGTVSGDQLSYVQSGGGIRTRVDLPFLDDFNDFDNVSMNRVQLIVPFEDDPKLPAQSSMFLVYKDTEGEYRLLPDQTFGTISGTADYSADHYIFNITLYIQKVLTGEITSEGLYLISRTAGVSVNRSILHGPHYSADNIDENMRLVVTFSY